MKSKRMSKFLQRLRSDTSGNALMLVAMGAPVIFGATGMGVDLAQVYMWKRELQYAADQAAVAGAWARGNGDVGVQYSTRAGQEFAANLSTTTHYSPSVNAELANWDGGTDNSVVVSGTLTTRLPFSQIVLNHDTTISVSAQAIWQTTDTYSPCLYALDPTAGGALLFNGGPTLNSECGIGARSDASDAVRINGSSGVYNVGFVVSGGGVSDGQDGFSEAAVMENMADMVDPFEDLTPPDNPVAQSLNCGSNATGIWTANETRRQQIAYRYYRGRNKIVAASSPAFDYDGPGMSSPSDTTGNPVTKEFPTEPVNYTDPQVFGTLYSIAGKGPDQVWEQAVTTTGYLYEILSAPIPTTDTALPPGTYADFDISCDTVLQGGIYVIDGGDLNVNANYSLTGAGVMFVLKNGAGIRINGGANINLSPMDATQLIAAGVDPADADKLAGMLIFEDPNSSGNTRNRLNGDARTVLNGVVYLPNSHLEINGGMTAESECLMIATQTLTIGGGANLTNLCPVDTINPHVAAEGGTRVRLVS